MGEYHACSVMQFVFIVIAFVFVGMAIWYAYDYSRIVFRPSEHVAVAEIIPLSSGLRGAMVRFLDNNPSHCGYSAANLRVYKQFLLLRKGDQYLDMINPRFEADYWARNTTHEEASSLCATEFKVYPHRLSAIVVTFETLNQVTLTLPLSYVEAWCVQHYVDIFNGKWMCGESEPDPRRIPYIPPEVHAEL